MKAKITMKDIAREAGVSLATVSHVVNGTKHITEEKHKKISDIIEKYNYVPNSMARNLRQQSTKTAALVVSSLPDSYIMNLTNGVSSRARELGYQLLFVNTNENHEYEKETVNLLASKNIDGLILSPTSSGTDYIKPFIKQNFPIVFMNRFNPVFSEIPRVTADDYQAGFDATSHLIGHGHQHIGVIYSVPNVTTTNNRLSGYQDALETSGLTFDEQFLEVGHATVEGGSIAAKKLLAAHKEITALLILSDLMTIGAFSALKSMSLKVPEDIAIVGYGDFAAATITEPPITNIGLPPDTIGKTAFDVLLNKIQNPLYNKHIQLPTSLIIRKSCGC